MAVDKKKLLEEGAQGEMQTNKPDSMQAFFEQFMAVVEAVSTSKDKEASGHISMQLFDRNKKELPGVEVFVKKAFRKGEKDLVN